MIIGFTGTQAGMSSHQKSRLQYVLTWLLNDLDDVRTPAPQFHHGDCIGSDYEAAVIAKRMGFWIVAWPPINPAKRGWFESNDEHEPGPYLERNRKMVDSVQRLIAAPKEMEETLRSGTWSTVRYARKVRKPVEILWPK
jgi:hypothetical protein